jgi:hypothetical protein
VSWSSGKNDPGKAPHALGLNAQHFDQAKAGAAMFRQFIAAAQQPVPPPTGAVAASQPDIADQILKLGELRDAGPITPAEFESKKAELLARM